MARMREIVAPYSRLRVPEVIGDLSTSRLLVMQDVQGGPISLAPEGDARTEAARQLLESFYKQIMVDGFFHADPHPGNLMWRPADDTLYLLDLGMVGEVGPEMREQLMLLLMAFWQEDVPFLTDVSLMLAGAMDRTDLDVDAFGGEIGEMVAKYRTASLSDIQLGPILQEMTEISLRHEVPLPASLALTGKALAQMQLATAELDPDLDPFDVAGSFLMRAVDARHDDEDRPEGALLPSAAVQGSLPSGRGSRRAPDRRAARSEARGELPGGDARDDDQAGGPAARPGAHGGRGHPRHGPHRDQRAGARVAARDVRRRRRCC